MRSLSKFKTLASLRLSVVIESVMALPSVPASARSNTARLTLRASGAMAARQNEDDRRCGRRLISPLPHPLISSERCSEFAARDCVYYNLVKTDPHCGPRPFAAATFATFAWMAASSWGIWQQWLMCAVGLLLIYLALATRLVDNAE